MSAPYAPPPVPQSVPQSVPQRRRRGGVVGPLVMIFIGGVFLLENTGYLPPNAWLNLWRLWPLLLVLAGIELLFAHRIPWIAVAGLASLVLVVGVAATMFTGFSGPSTVASGAPATSARTDLGGATQAAVTVRFGAGELNVGPLVQAVPDQLALMTFDGPAELAPQPRYQATNGGTGQLVYQINGRSGPSFIPFISGSDALRLDLSLSPTVPITSLNIQIGATTATLDLSSLQVSNLDMSVGAAMAKIRLPQIAGTTSVHISGGMSTITLDVPQGVAAQIRHRGGLNTLNVDQTRFPGVDGGVYRSADYATAQNKIDLNLETGVTTIQVN